jgi:hypothetical protein
MDELCQSLFEIFTNKQERLLEYDIDEIILNDTHDESHFILCENNLLINKKSIKHLYRHVHKKFLSKDLINQDDVYSLMIVIINPNFASAWLRRKLCINDQIRNNDVINDELYLNQLVLNKHFKCEHAFMYRRWLVRQQRETVKGR